VPSPTTSTLVASEVQKIDVYSRSSQEVFVPLSLGTFLSQAEAGYARQVFRLGSWNSPHLKDGPNFSSLDIGFLKLHGGSSVTEQMVPVAVEIKMDSCCTTCCWDVALGARRTPRKQGTGGAYVAITEQDGMAQDFVTACTRGKVCPGQTLKLPMPPDLRGKTLGEYLQAMPAFIVHGLGGENCLVLLYWRLWFMGGSCTML
jgi:hypothetical protein